MNNIILPPQCCMRNDECPVRQQVTLSVLSPREQEILERVARGESNKQIAHAFEIATGTVKNHLVSIMEKLGVSNRTHAVVLAIEYGWIPSNYKEEKDEQD